MVLHPPEVVWGMSLSEIRACQRALYAERRRQAVFQSEMMKSLMVAMFGKAVGG
jgi:hypothetical protein